MAYSIAVLGAASAAGAEILEVLGERGFKSDRVTALDSRSSLGRSVSLGDRTIKTKDAEDFDFSSVDLCVLAVGERAARKWAPRVLAAGTYLIDISPAFRMDADTVLVSPEANPQVIEQLDGRRKLAVPGGAAALLTTVLKPILETAGIKRVVATACMSVSELGRIAMDELWIQTKGIYVNQAPEPKEFNRQIAFNLIPQVGDFRDDGATDEEQRLTDETARILDGVSVAATCIQVPVFVGHSIAVHLELERPIAINALRDLLREAPGVVVIDNREEETFVTPIETVGEWGTYVSRIREDPTVPNGVALWIVGDNMRKAAALNAILTAELLSNTGAFAKRVES